MGGVVGTVGPKGPDWEAREKSKRLWHRRNRANTRTLLNPLARPSLHRPPHPGGGAMGRPKLGPPEVGWHLVPFLSLPGRAFNFSLLKLSGWGYPSRLFEVGLGILGGERTRSLPSLISTLRLSPSPPFLKTMSNPTLTLENPTPPSLARSSSPSLFPATTGTP